MSRKKKSFYEKKGYKEPLKLTKENDTLRKVYDAHKNEINASFKSFKECDFILSSYLFNNIYC